MATENQNINPQKQRGEGVLPKGKSKNAALGPDGKNRVILGDIGNLVAARAPIADGKPHPHTSRPITRSFGAQLIANAQAAAAAVNKKPGVVIDDGAAKKSHVVETKPKPEVVVIDISPDTSEERRKQRSRKKIHSLTSVLTARSKVAAGITDIRKESIPDIDASDAGDQLAVVEYIDDIYKFYKLSENSSRTRDYMDSQVEINAKMRAILADWMIEVHTKFELMPETLYLTFYVLDQYLSMKKILRKEFQLVGVSAMLIACKYEEIWAPEVSDFISISDRVYSREQILIMEKEILNVLEWNLTVPTPYVFLVRFVKAAICDKEMENMVYFFAELSLMQYLMISYCPSMIAASAVYAARCTLKKSPLWTETLKRHTGFSETQLLDCAKILVKCHVSAPHDKLKFVYKKYSSTQLGAVAMHSPAIQLLEEMKASSSSTDSR